MLYCFKFVARSWLCYKLRVNSYIFSICNKQKIFLFKLHISCDTKCLIFGEYSCYLTRNMSKLNMITFYFHCRRRMITSFPYSSTLKCWISIELGIILYIFCNHHLIKDDKEFNTLEDIFKDMPWAIESNNI